MMEINEANNETNDLGIKKVGHLYENIKFDCDDNIKECSADFHSDYLEIIENAASRNYDALNQLINDIFDADIKNLEDTLTDREDINPEDKKKFFFNKEAGKIIDDFRSYVKIIYVEHILFDILNIGLKDLGNNNITEILKSKQEARINNFINSMVDNKNNNAILPYFDSNFKTDYTNRVQDKNNFLRYVTYFNYLAVFCGFVQSETKSLKEINDKKVKDLQNKIEKNNKSIEENKNKLNNLSEEIKTLQKQINQYQERLKDQTNQLKTDDAKNKRIKEQML